MPLAACGGPLSTLDPAGPVAGGIARLWWVMLGGSAVLFLLMMGLFVLAVWRPGGLARVPASRLVLWGGVVMPVVVLVSLLAVALAQGERDLHPSAAASDMRIAVEARMWEWRFRYPPGHDPAESVNRLYLPVGETVELSVTSEDVIHSFWIPSLAGKIDAIPGRTNTIRLRADRPGMLGGQCSEYCGPGHPGMAFDVIIGDSAAEGASR